MTEILLTAATILVVDDEEKLLDIMSESIRVSGFRVLTATCGNDAFKKLTTNKVDLVLSDINMPNLSGLELLAKCRKEDISTPFVFITGSSSTEILIEAVRLGAMDFVLKPFEFSALERTVKRVMAISEKQEQIEELLNSLGQDMAPQIIFEINILRRQINVLKTMGTTFE